MGKSVPITADDIECALEKLTWIIETHSEAAWPLFDRLERELETRLSRQAKLARRRQSSKSLT